MTVNSFRSVYEDRLFRFIKSQQIQILEKIKNSEELSKAEEEYQELFAEYEKSLSQLKDEELKRELAELELDDARKIIEQYKSNIKTLSEQINLDKSGNETLQMKVSRPFNICVLGEVSDQALIRNELNKYFEKLGIMATDWNVDFFNNTKLGNTNLLRSLQKGQSKYSIIITGQIFHHSGKGNSKANIISELKNEKYIPHIVGAPPRDLLTPDKIKEAIHNYLTSETR